MTKEIKDLITAGMLEDLFGYFEVLRQYDDGDDDAPEFCNSIEIAFGYFKTQNDVDVQSDDLSNHYRDRVVSFYELKDKLEEWIVKRIDEMSEIDTFCDIPIFTIKMPQDDKCWWAGVEYYNGDVCVVDRKPLNYMGETKTEALLKLYHAIKATNAAREI